jgi:uncharacterized YigZ family protein
MISDDTYQTLSSLSQGVYREKGSKFIALACPVFSEEEVKEKLDGWRKEYYDARHHSYAYRLGPENPVYRVNDDGEPSGSAGRPIYGQILSNDLMNVLIVVIRYFGGTKLGIPGLIHAYKTSSQEAIANGAIVSRTITERLHIIFNYVSMNEVMKIVKSESALIHDQQFGNRCEMTVSVRLNAGERVRSRLEKIEELTVGSVGKEH